MTYGKFRLLAALFIAAPLAAQTKTTDHALLFGAYGGGYKPIMDLAGPTAYFAPGTDWGATVGYEFTPNWALHGDFTYTRSRAEGNATFAGMMFDRYFYGAHAELGYAMGTFTPYLFFGGGAVTIDEVGSDAKLTSFTRPAGMFGAGTFWALGGSNLGLFAEFKNLVYNWDRGGPVPVSWYIPITGGGAYPVESNLHGFDSVQWDFTYTIGVSYRFPLGARHTQTHTPGDE
jgi:hypothetical protein